MTLNAVTFEHCLIVERRKEKRKGERKREGEWIREDQKRRQL